MTHDTPDGWTFVDDEGTFALPEPQRSSFLYFPLVGETGMVSAVTPTLHGDVKTGQNSFLTPPVSVEDLHASRAARNFWVYVEGYGAWSATGNSARQIAANLDDTGGERTELQAGLLWHRLLRTHSALGLQAEVLNFVPPGADAVELMQVTLRNTGAWPLALTPTAAVPLYGRSADNLRDHRHVTALLHRVRTHTHGVLLRPTLSFDERGHRPNGVTYAVLGVEGEAGAPPVAFFPTVAAFSGEGGTLDWPVAAVDPGLPGCAAGQHFAGEEAMGGLRFRPVTLQPGACRTYILILAIGEGEGEGKGELDPDALVERYGSEARCADWLARTQAHWEQQLGGFRVQLSDTHFNRWMRWVTLQPVLRRRCGNSFLPYHDYGRGGRGWRDLWQDLLALTVTEPDAAQAVGPLLLGNFAGVRADGSNATIVGTQPGEFKADRNDIPRVWMDHGAWPLLTTRLYVDTSGDLGFLLRGQTYFKDAWVDRARARDENWQPEHGTLLRTRGGVVYRGSVLEHLLVQHLSAFFNVGEHNTIRLEGADWNDGLDMAPERGESVAFSALYAGNLRLLAQLALELERRGTADVTLAAELLPLLDRLGGPVGLGGPVDYGSVDAKRARLAGYFDNVRHGLSGEQVEVRLRDLAADLTAKADWLCAHLRAQEWIEGRDGCGWFNGYYDEDGRRLEGDSPEGARMTLTAQTFALMGSVATEAQARAIARAADRYLYDPQVGGYRLNTDFGAVDDDALSALCTRLDARLSTRLGRCFGFAFGHKENGAMFTHMAVMYANALYQRGMAREGHRVLDGIYRHCRGFAASRMYPGLPEYVGPRGRGMYPYLTGSASWYLLTLLTEVFGVRGTLGDLLLEPKLLREQFGVGGEAGVQTAFAGRRLEVVYRNPTGVDYAQYRVGQVQLNGAAVDCERRGGAAVLARGVIEAAGGDGVCRLDIELE